METELNSNINLLIKNYVDSLLNTNADLIPLDIKDINPDIIQDKSDTYYNFHSIEENEVLRSYIQLNNTLHNEPNTISLITNNTNNTGKIQLLGDVNTPILNSNIIKSNIIYIKDSDSDNDNNTIHFIYDDNNLYCEDNLDNSVDISVNKLYVKNLITDNILSQIGEYDENWNTALRTNVNNTIHSNNIYIKDRVNISNIISEELQIMYNNNASYIKIYTDPTSTSYQDTVRVYEQNRSTASDHRFKYKESLLDISFSSEILKDINSYQYKYKKEKESNTNDYGFMADEVQDIFADAVYTNSTLIDNENVSCVYDMIYDTSNNINSIELKNIVDNEFDKECQFYMMYCSCDFSTVPVYEIKIENSECSIDTTHNIYYIGQYQTDHIREYLYAYKNNIRIKIDGTEHNTRLKYNPNNETNRITIDISGIPITKDMRSLEIYRPIECVTYISNVIDTNDNDDNTRNYILNITSDIDNEFKKINDGEMIWYKVAVKDGRSLDYRKIFMQYHNVIKDKYNENIKLKTKLEELEREVEEIEKHIENV